MSLWLTEALVLHKYTPGERYVGGKASDAQGAGAPEEDAGAAVDDV